MEHKRYLVRDVRRGVFLRPQRPLSVFVLRPVKGAGERPLSCCILGWLIPPSLPGHFRPAGGSKRSAGSMHVFPSDSSTAQWWQPESPLIEGFVKSLRSVQWCSRVSD